MKLVLESYLPAQSLTETIEVLDEVLYLLVLKTEYLGYSEDLTHQYLTIRELRNLFIDLKEQGNE